MTLRERPSSTLGKQVFHTSGVPKIFGIVSRNFCNLVYDFTLETHQLSSPIRAFRIRIMNQLDGIILFETREACVPFTYEKFSCAWYVHVPNDLFLAFAEIVLIIEVDSVTHCALHSGLV